MTKEKKVKKAVSKSVAKSKAKKVVKTAASKDIKISNVIRARIKKDKGDFKANDSISDYIKEGETDLLIEEVAGRFEQVLKSLLIDTNNDHNTADTAMRVAKMYVNEVFHGRYMEEPSITEFPNHSEYDNLIVVGPIEIKSTCSHHLLPIVGRAHIAYISNGTVVGLSKMNRVVDYYAKRPQVQERLTIQIVKELQEVLGTDDVACIIDAKHLCVNSRGIRDIESSTVTSEYGGKFKEHAVRRELLDYIQLDTQF